MFAEEAALHRRFVHKNIVACYGAGAVDGEPFLAMELVHGADLHRILRLSQTRRRPTLGLMLDAGVRPLRASVW